MKPQKKRSLLRSLLRAALWLLIPVSWLWSLGALWFFPDAPLPLRVATIFLWISVTLAVFIFLPAWPLRLTCLLSGTLLIWLILVWAATPRDDRRWVPDQERVVEVDFAKDDATVLIKNIRDWHYHSDTNPVRWLDQNYDLSQIVSADYIIEPFANWRGLAHVFISFGFADGDHVAISVEARRQQGQPYTPLRGIYRNYEVIYVIARERDVIGLRTNIRNHPVYVYPLKATPVALRSLFRTLLEKAAALKSKPAFYDTLTNTCTGNIVVHANDLLNRKISLLDWRMIFPGYSDELGIQMDLFDTPLNLDQAREKFRINERSAWHEDAKIWSAQIRETTSSS